MKNDGLEISDRGNEAEHFSQFFLLVFTAETAFATTSDEIESALNIEHILFGEETIFQELKSLKECISPDPDEISTKLFREPDRELTETLSLMYQKSFNTEILPPD
ncbi:unnamed protein product [Dibothriocephalus latus]|uniref:Uncharacterized protein n=1 Tax=Dibothriocephalus latus TaxID=60516 RepID=A0A3P7LU62_DIBLA|nr:unnamed protein product [Dibothriocephalus latus]